MEERNGQYKRLSRNTRVPISKLSPPTHQSFELFASFADINAKPRVGAIMTSGAVSVIWLTRLFGLIRPKKVANWWPGGRTAKRLVVTQQNG